MRKLIEITTHPQLVQEIVGQFVFMILMAETEDHKFKEIQSLNLQDIFNKADNYFIQFSDQNKMIFTEEHNLTEKITEFLKEWEEIVDVTAIQQNIHYKLLVMDKEL